MIASSVPLFSLEFFSATLLLCLGLASLLKKYFLHQRFLNYIVHPSNQKRLIVNHSSFKNKMRYFTFALGCFAAFACFLRLYWGEQKLTLKQSGRTILFALDISRSMLATDVSEGHVSRLDLAKWKIRSLIEELGPERIGLVLFADTAFLQCPFTKDPNNFYAFLDQIDSTVVSSAAETSIIKPVQKAIDIFKNMQVGSKIMILFSDGEDFSETENNLIDQAKQEKIALCALGIGSESGAPVPILDPLGQKVVDHEKDKNGKLIFTKLNKQKLKKITSGLGGVYSDAYLDDRDINNIKKFINKFESDLYEDLTVTLKNDLYPFCALITAILFAIEACL